MTPLPYEPGGPEDGGIGGGAACPYDEALGGDGGSGARTLLRDLERSRSRVADFDLERDDLSSGLRDIFAGHAVQGSGSNKKNSRRWRKRRRCHETEQTIVLMPLCYLFPPVRQPELSSMHAMGGSGTKYRGVVWRAAHSANERGRGAEGPEALREPCSTEIVLDSPCVFEFLILSTTSLP